jgi:hypothetical protein
MTPNASPKKTGSLLPLLTVVFVISYVLMTMLIVEQGAAIQSQSNLIHILQRDSSELWAAKGKAIAQQRAAQGKTQSGLPAKDHAAQGVTTPKHQAGQAGKTTKPAISLPPAPASDLLDQRRSLSTI